MMEALLSIAPSLRPPRLGTPSLRSSLVALSALVAGSVASYVLYYVYNYRALSALPGYEASADYKVASFAYPTSDALRVRFVNLDNTLLQQTAMIAQYSPEMVDVAAWGPPLRLDCSFAQFWAFERALAEQCGSATDDGEGAAPLVTFYGSNDFHHVALALVRRFRQPFNVVLFDNHPDWMRYYPGLHCGCWFSHVMALPTVQHAFHVGGASGEFEDWWAFHPWDRLKDGRLVVYPSEDVWSGLQWRHVAYQPLRSPQRRRLTEARVRLLLAPHRDVLEAYPLYVTLDKDCMVKEDNYQNWNSGCLTRGEVLTIVKVLVDMAKGRLLACDVTGDFSPVEVSGLYRSYLHYSQHDDEENLIDPAEALPSNVQSNLAILDTLRAAIAPYVQEST